jgi:predicted nucleotidyltransferase
MLSDMKTNFESFLGKSVDLLTPQAISKYFRDKVLAEAEYVYER